jgi:hypothetical protein
MRNSPSPYMSVGEVAAHFRVSQTSIYRARGVFADLRVVEINGRRMVFRSDVEALDRELAHRAVLPKERARLRPVKKRA